MDSFSWMMEECDYPETIKMEMLDNRYRFRTNGDFLLLFYSSSSPRLILPESIAHPGTYSSLRWGVDSNVWTE